MLDIALVSYINTRPFMDGLAHVFQSDELNLNLLAPAKCAAHLADGCSELALIPVGAIPDFQRIHLMANFCIGANGPVESVFLFSQKPVEELETVILDRHSRSSNGLARILLRHHWCRDMQFLTPNQKHFDLIEHRTGGIVIGDKAIKIRQNYRYAYDLSEEWKKLTGLPFAFAVWAYKAEKLDNYLLYRLNQAMEWGVRQAQNTADKWANHFNIPLPFARHYLKNCIDFNFDAPKHRALRLYLDELSKLPILQVPSFV